MLTRQQRRKRTDEICDKVDKVRSGIISDFHKQMRAQNISLAQLGRIIGTTREYTRSLLNPEQTTMTFRTAVRVAEALNMRFEAWVIPNARPLEGPTGQKQGAGKGRVHQKRPGAAQKGE